MKITLALRQPENQMFVINRITSKRGLLTHYTHDYYEKLSIPITITFMINRFVDSFKVNWWPFGNFSRKGFFIFMKEQANLCFSLITFAHPTLPGLHK